MRNLLTLIPILLILSSACNREYDPAPVPASELFPMEVGNYRIYEVRDTLFNSTQDSLPETYFLREEAVGTEIDLDGRENLVLWLSRAPDTGALPSAEAFEYHSLVTEFLGEGYVERVESNHRYISMALPATEGRTWNGNLYNEQGSQTYRILSRDSIVQIKGNTYGNCVVVEKQAYEQVGSLDPGSPYFREAQAYEVYAPGVGLVKRFEKQVEMQRTNSPNWQIHPESRIWVAEIVARNY